MASPCCQGCSSHVCNGENARQPGTDADKETPLCAERVVGPGDDPPRGRIHASQLRHHKRARNEEGETADTPIEETGRPSNGNGGDICHPEDIEQKQADEIPGAEDGRQKL